MARRRFLVVWFGFGLLYLVIAAAGPSGLLVNGVWPQINQHLVQVRAWLGDDIIVEDAGIGGERLIQVRPRLDVTPYFQNWVIEDPRERVLMANLACGVPDTSPGKPMREIRYVAPDTLIGRTQTARLVCHVGSPLGPAFLLLPLYLVLGSALATQWLGALMGGLAVATIDLFLVRWVDTVRGEGTMTSGERAGILALAGLGTLWIWLVPQGEMWMFAQTTATTCLALAIFAGWQRRWLWAGLAFGLAITARPPTLLAAPLLLAILLFRIRGLELTGRAIRRWRAIAVAALFPVAAMGTQLVLNDLRFSSPLEFGYRYMLTPPELRHRQEQHGAFSLAFLAGNFRYLVWQPPVVVVDRESGQVEFPFLVSDPKGMGLLFVTPAFLAAVLTLRRHWRAPQLLAACWFSLGLVTLPALLYFNTGWVQWGGRYLLDAWPMWLMLAVLGLSRLDRRIAGGLIWISVVSNAWAAVVATTGRWP